MAKKENFFLNEIDRTPYTSCAWVAVFVIAFFFVFASLFWRMAGTVKHSSFFKKIGLPSYDTEGSDILNKVKDISGQKVEDSSQQAKDAASQALKDEANKQIEEQKNAAKTQAADQLKSYFSQ